MDALNWRLFFVWLCFNAVQTEASSWTADVPSTVKGHLGSCVVIPCSFSYPDHGKKVTGFTGIWTEASNHHVVYHPVKSNIAEQYRDRTELLGDLKHKNCSLQINLLKISDQGPFFFRIEMADFESFSYKEHPVSITMMGKIDAAISLTGDIVEGQLVVAYCSVSPSCPTSLPVFTWSHSGEEHFHSLQFDDNQWKATAALSFRPTNADHDKSLWCTAQYSGGQQETSKLLKVKHAPVNVKVEYKSDVKEGEAVRLTCTSDAHPPASSYEWSSETGAQLHLGNHYTMPNVSRHMGAVYCTAINTVGRGKSSPVRVMVLYAPEVRSVSSCTSEGKMVKCVCIAESQPPCMVHFVLSERVLPGTKIERHGPVTMGTLEAEFESSEFVHCLANNTLGNANVVLSLPVNGEMQSLYIGITIGGVTFLVILLMAVGLVKKCGGTSGETPTPDICTLSENKEELSECATVKRKEMNYDVETRPNHPMDDHVYGNMETEFDDAIYANV